MILLLLSLTALALTPAIHAFALKNRWLLAGLDGFVLVSIGGVVLLHIIPDSVGVTGAWALAFAAIGLFGPGLLERKLHQAAATAHAGAVVLAMFGLGLHAFMDGVVLGTPATPGDGDARLLALAVTLHRVPEGLTIWWLIRPSYGARAAGAVLAFEAILATLGYATGETALIHLDRTPVALFSALVAGSLLHVVVHRPHPLLPPYPGQPRFAAAGALVGLVLLLVLGHEEGHASGPSAVQSFLSLALECAPALLLAYAIAGVLQANLPHGSAAWINRGGAIVRAVRGAAFGLPRPIYSCGVLPMYRSLIHGGASGTGALAFLVATPGLSLDALLMSIPLLGLPLAGARVLAAAAVALIVGVLVGGRIPPRDGAQDRTHDEEAPRGFVERARDSVRAAFGEIVDHTLPWIVLGLMVSAVVGPLAEHDWVRQIPTGVEVAAFALLGLPVYVCASGATPLVAVLIHAGVSPGAAIAFLLTGPATNATTFGVLSELHGRRTALGFAGALGVASIALGHLVNVVLPRAAPPPLPAAGAAEGAGAVAVASLAVLAALFMVSLFRQGPREMVGQILAPPLDDAHERDHDHGHDHGDVHEHEHDHDHDHVQDHERTQPAPGGGR